MSIWQVFGFIGLGTVIGATIQVYFNSRMQNKKLIFEARVKAYQGLIGRIYSFFVPEIKNKEWPDYEVNINSFLSEPLLLGSDELVKMITEYRHLILAFIPNLKNLDDNHPIIKEQFDSIKNYSKKIIEQMRKDLKIE